MRRIVVVDRDAKVADAIERALGGSFDVQPLAPHEALGLATALHYDFLLCEWNLGAVPARRIVDAALARRHRPRVWITHEHRPDAEAAEYAARRGVTLLAKPIRALDLSTRVA